MSENLILEKKRKILKDRAIKLAATDKEFFKEKKHLETVVFTLANEIYAIESQYIREVYPLKDFTKLPSVPSFVFGIINVRRHILTVIDLKVFFDLTSKQQKLPDKIIILESNEGAFAILADSIEGIRQIALDEMQASLITLTGVRQLFLKGITQDGVIILDGKKLLNEKILIVNQIVNEDFSK